MVLIPLFVNSDRKLLSWYVDTSQGELTLDLKYNNTNWTAQHVSCTKQKTRQAPIKHPPKNVSLKSYCYGNLLGDCDTITAIFWWLWVVELVVKMYSGSRSSTRYPKQFFDSLRSWKGWPEHISVVQNFKNQPEILFPETTLPVLNLGMVNNQASSKKIIVVQGH